MHREQDDQPIALEAYEALADRYAARIDSKAENAFVETPATLSLLPEVEGKRVLDSGCGPGAKSEWLLDQGAEVVALDCSPKMIEHARRRVGTRAEIRLVDLRKPLDFLDDDSFDIVLCALVLDYLRDWVPLFTEFHRVLHESGLLVFSVGHPYTEFKYHGSDDYFRTELVEMFWRGFGGEPVRMPSYRRPLCAMTSAVEETGFAIQRIVEPQPLEECKSVDPETYEQLLKRPSFLCVSALRKP